MRKNERGKNVLNIFCPVSEEIVQDIIKARTLLNVKPDDEWFNRESEILSDKLSHGILKKNEYDDLYDALKYRYYRKKLDVYTDTCFTVRSMFLKPMKNEEHDIQYLNKMWNWVHDEGRRKLAIEDTVYKINILKKEINANISLRKAEKWRVNIFTFVIAILSGIGGALIVIK
jgi:hypothetical protein